MTNLNLKLRTVILGIAAILTSSIWIANSFGASTWANAPEQAEVPAGSVAIQVEQHLPAPLVQNKILIRVGNILIVAGNLAYTWSLFADKVESEIGWPREYAIVLGALGTPLVTSGTILRYYGGQ